MCEDNPFCISRLCPFCRLSSLKAGAPAQSGLLVDALFFFFFLFLVVVGDERVGLCSSFCDLESSVRLCLLLPALSHRIPLPLSGWLCSSSGSTFITMTGPMLLAPR